MPKHIAAITVAPAAGVGGIVDFLAEPDERGQSPAHVKRWLKLYRSHRDLRRSISPFPVADDGGDWLTSLQASLRSFDRLPPDDKVEIVTQLTPEAIAEARQFWESLIDLGRCIVYDEVYEDDVGQFLGKDVSGLRFFIHVYWPCVLRHQCEPAVLLRDARRGDADALCDLLSIDKTVLAEPRITSLVTQLSSRTRSNDLRKIARAVGKPRVRSFDRWSAKAVVAAYIAEQCARLNHPLTAPKIRELFDAIAVARGSKRDNDLPRERDTFYKAIVRLRPSIRQWMAVGQKSRA